MPAQQYLYTYYSNQASMGVSVIIPAYDEDTRLIPSLKSIVQYMDRQKIDHEIIIVDDSSKNPITHIKGLPNNHINILRNSSNRGKGYSVRRGMLAAEKDHIMFTDSDLAAPIEELDKLMGYIEDGYDIAVASRNLEGSEIVVRQPLYRRLLGKGFPLLVNLLGLSRLKDTQCGLKLFTRDAARQLARLQTIDGFAFDAEIMHIAEKRGMRVAEVPVKWVDKEGSKVRIMKDSLSMFSDLIRIRINSWAGKYEKKKQRREDNRNH
ncbi:glycosyltransferase [Candidatus Woesearchaeota archaeon]|nr:glycosyltransferase [Candidatus Woesearchaeota archaeon]